MTAALWVALVGGGAGAARAQPLDPAGFASLGSFPAAAGTYTVNTSGTPSLTGPDGFTLTGVLAGNVAVFTFDSIMIGTGQGVVAIGTRPVAFLSKTDVTISGSGLLNASGQSTSTYAPGAGGPGGGAGGEGGFTGSTGVGPGGGVRSGGGGFGGTGGTGYSGIGGGTYGDLDSALVGGSGGGGARSSTGQALSGGGGGGGGGIEVGALGAITIGGSGIFADGGKGGDHAGAGLPVGGGGGSGGGILLHATTVSLAGPVSARGGQGGVGWAPWSPEKRPGGGGGGGRVTVLTEPDGFTGLEFIDVSGGLDGLNLASGSVGVVEVLTPVPEPATWLVTGLGVVGSVLFARRAGGRGEVRGGARRTGR
jgi:hypothetical protein